jgi:hypothetical protein
MTDGKSVVEQAHEIQYMAKELEHLKINLPDKFVAGGIIAKLPPSWRDFATTLKHKRMEISVSDLIASLDVEEKARAKDGRSKAAEGQTSANMVQKSHSKGKGKGKKDQAAAYHYFQEEEVQGRSRLFCMWVFRSLGKEVPTPQRKEAFT